MKALAAAFNQEKALVGAFSVIVKTDCETDVNLEQSQRCDGELHNFGGSPKPSFQFRSLKDLQSHLKVFRELVIMMLNKFMDNFKRFSL